MPVDADPTPSAGRRVVITGLPGSGKTTLAAELAASMPACRMCPDDWMMASGIDLWDESARARIEGFQLALSLDLLRNGHNGIIEWGTWAREERDALRDAARSIGAPSSWATPRHGLVSDGQPVGASAARPPRPSDTPDDRRGRRSRNRGPVLVERAWEAHEVQGQRPSASAQVVACCRAVLTSMGVINDPHAAAMLHRPYRALARCLTWPPLSRLARSPTLAFLAARTRFFDDAVTSALDGGVQQVAVIGAGYDSRAWRLARPGVRFFEVDHPATQRDKRQRAPGPGPAYVAADLGSDRLSALLPLAGFDASRPTVFIVEGLTMYLPETATRTLLSDLAALAPPDSCLAANFTVTGGGSVSTPSRAVAWLTRKTWQARGEPTHRWVQPHLLPELLSSSGWMANDLVNGPDLAARYLTGQPNRMLLDGLNPGAICVAADRSMTADPPAPPP